LKKSGARLAMRLRNLKIAKEIGPIIASYVAGEAEMTRRRLWPGMSSNGVRRRAS
jgi:hypothetical protein